MSTTNTLQEKKDNQQDSFLSPSTKSFEYKPLMRGWLHAGFAPIVFIAGIVLIALSGGGWLGLGCAIFALTGVMLFGFSGMYHRAYWPERLRLFFKRLDHANIALVIAGTYTPLAMTLLSGTLQTVLLWSIWGCALLVVLFRVFWTHAPRWLYTPIYVVMGLIAVFYLGDFWSVSPTATILIAVGGAFYILGATFYGTKRPRLSPRYFGFHELFHVCTIIGFVLHFIAVMFAIYA
ncbi:hemolysin III family protein [uncultured Rothia sp.]|uniref:PAQR family membrane homeostasis protein TrhA n=1 Tax=uncultured Rothia sp. TaxID=316088 RepID=UPI003216E9A8